jgi:ubiquinone/menaquinone biosynthesis C-methylase UbiE
MSDNAAGFTGSIPEEYDSGLGPVIFTDYAAVMAGLVAEFGPNRVLETAAGTGIVTRSLRDNLNPECSLIATDLNPPMLAVARDKFQPDEAVEFQQADATDLPFANEAFDAVVCQFGMMFLPDKEKGYLEAARVLATGGRYFFSVWDSRDHNAFGRLSYEIGSKFFPTDPPQFYQVPFGYSMIDPIKKSLADAGFARIGIHVVPLQKKADIPAFARGVVFGNPLFDQIKARGGPSCEDVAKALTEVMRQEFADDMVSMQAIFFEARKR